MTEDTVLVSVMTVNNEIGVEQPVAEIGMLIQLYCKHIAKCQAYMYVNTVKYGYNEHFCNELTLTAKMIFIHDFIS